MTDKYRYVLEYKDACGRLHRSTHNLEGLIREIRRLIRGEVLRRAQLDRLDLSELVDGYGVEEEAPNGT